MKFTKIFIKSALIRALKTAAQVALGMFTVGQMCSEVDWLKILSVAGVSAIYSILTSIATGLPESKVDGSLIMSSNEEKDIFQFEIDKPIEEIKPGDTFILNVKED